MKKIVWILLLGMLSVGHRAAADGVDVLHQFLREAKSGHALFVQTVHSQGGRTKQSSGEFWFSRPNKFRWQYKQPYPQLFVADGQKLFLHDVDLQQVTIKPLKEAIGSTPAVLLAGSSDVERSFVLKNGSVQEGLQWVVATPKQNDSGFNEIRLGFRGQRLERLQLTDSFGQTSELQFSQWQINSGVAAHLWQFTPPSGTDIVDLSATAK